ncbi:MAG: Mov34/MPN/PAD-1 family protein [Proteobacteria bacterium]|nr:Mov34/MPN/PAD-1 family protein [Pseudomonadota bacterium]
MVSPTPKLVISDDIQTAIFRHAREMASMTPPQEAAGVIKFSKNTPRYIACRNMAANPHHSFRIRRGELDRHAPLAAIVHSHPGGPSYPSMHDMQQQIASNLPWLIAVVATASKPNIHEEMIVWGGEAKIQEDAGYRHGVSDCYGLIRGWYQSVCGVALPDFPRPWEWWLAGGDLYRQYFAEAGFTHIPPSTSDEIFTPQIGDVFLASIRSPVPNHAGIYIGEGLILHHLAGRDPVALHRLPSKEPIERWRKFITMWLRHRHHQHQHQHEGQSVYV